MKYHKIHLKKIVVKYILTIIVIFNIIYLNNITSHAISESEIASESNGVTEIIEVKELDLGDYSATMEVGSKQLLVVTAIPLNASEEEITYSSSKTNIANINGMGRITAVSTGKTKITVKCGKIKESFTLTVVQEQKETYKETYAETYAGVDTVNDVSEEYISVKSLEIADYEEKLEVGKTVELSATVVPQNATDATVNFSSSDTSIATVTSSGEVKGKRKGEVVIYASAGGVTKSVELFIKVVTKKLTLNETYLVLKKGSTFQLKSSAIPEDADQNITYKIADENIASVSEIGLIEAKEEGTTVVIWNCQY